MKCKCGTEPETYPAPGSLTFSKSSSTSREIRIVFTFDTCYINEAHQLRYFDVKRGCFSYMYAEWWRPLDWCSICFEKTFREKVS